MFHRLTASTSLAMLAAALGVTLVAGAARAQDAGTPPSAEQLVDKQPDTGLADTLVDLGTVYFRQGKFDKATDAYRRAWEARQQRLGATHPMTLEAMNGLAGSLASSGDAPEAIELYEQLLAAYGEQTLAAAGAHQNLAVVLTRAGRYEEAAGHYEAALAIREEKAGPEHPLAYASIDGLAGAQAAMGRWEPAEASYRRLLEGRESSHGEASLPVADVLHNLGVVLTRQGKHEEAAEAYEEAVAIRRELRKPDAGPDARLMAAMSGAAAARAGQGDWERALAIYDELLAMQVDAVGREHPAVAATLYGRAIVLERTGETEEAEKAFREALSIREQKLGASHPQTLVAVLGLGRMLLGAGDAEGAVKLFERLLAAQEDALGEDSPRLAPTLRQLGQIYSSQGELGKASAYLERAAMLQGEAPERAEPKADLEQGMKNEE